MRPPKNLLEIPDIFEILKSVDSNQEFVDTGGSFLKYKLDKAMGYLDLDGSKSKPSGYQTLISGVHSKSLFDNQPDNINLNNFPKTTRTCS